MTLLRAILQKAKSQESLNRKYSSPPPEIEEEVIIPKKKKYVHQFAHVVARVDSSPPRLDPRPWLRCLPVWRSRFDSLYAQNMRLLTLIKRAHFTRGRVDSRWRQLPPPSLQFYRSRVDFLKQVEADNNHLYKRILKTKARVATAASLHSDWQRNRREMVLRAECKFVLFPPVPRETIEDCAFVTPEGVHRPRSQHSVAFRVHITLRVLGNAVLGELTAELFPDVCPATCRLFLELLEGDRLGHGYVGTCFFRKVPGLYWSGGDVICDNGFGCYAQRNRTAPIGAENYHFSHSMPGLLSMRVTRDDEMCGIFNITFKPLPQFDLKNVVFGRIIRPSSTYDMIHSLGSPLSVHPVIVVESTRRWTGSGWVRGLPNTHLSKRTTSLRQ